MNKYNQWEEEYKLHNKFSCAQKNRQYLELMELAYKIVPKERIEMLYREKLEKLIDERKILLEAFKKVKENDSQNS